MLANLLPNVQSIGLDAKIEVPFLDPAINCFNHLNALYVTIKSPAEILRVLKCCPNLKKIVLRSELSGEFPDDDFSMPTVEEIELFLEFATILTNIHKILKKFPNAVKLSLGSWRQGRLDCDPVQLFNLETLKFYFTKWEDECNNMYHFMRHFPSLKNLEICSELIGELKTDGPKMECLETLTVESGDTLNTFKNLINLIKISPNLKKLDFYNRLNLRRTNDYKHSDEISGWELENFSSIEELKGRLIKKSEIGILKFLCGSCRCAKKINCNLVNEDLNGEEFEKILEMMTNVEEMNFGKYFEYNENILWAIRRNLLNLKKLTIFTSKPLEVQRLVRKIFDPAEIEFVYNPNCLEEWTDDGIVKVNSLTCWNDPE